MGGSELRIRERERFLRVGMHSHVKGLGIRDGKVLPSADGLVGQVEARAAAFLIVRMIREGKMAGRAVLLAGPPGTGKTAIAVAIARELGEDTPFVAMSGSEIYSAEIKKTEVLMQAMRKAIGIRIHDFRKIYEGVVTRLNIKYGKHPYNPYQQIPVGAAITLKTKMEERTFEVDELVTGELLAKGVSEGDVIWIDAESGRVTKVGRSKDYAPKYDIGGMRVVEIPDGTIAKEREFVYTVTLHDLDVMHARSGSILSMIFGGREEKEIPSDVRNRVDETVKEWVDNGRAEIIPGVLFIDDVHMLDIEAFSFLSRAMESELAPIIILASNRGFARIRGTEVVSPHGIPLDLLDRLLIIETKPYTKDEIKEILKIRAREENVDLSEEALEELTNIGAERSLRYAVQLLTPARIIAQSKGSNKVLKEYVDEVKKLFVDVKESAKYLKEFEESFLR
ncbi:MAG: TATA box-binding protein [Thermoprotei archaeon]|nr:MAG: TATA box-binding protein [Thermoprotei archaeon]RLF02892.1 MAG: TATA box-binding protein [Thermoprotei archaeon]